jgi:hypothetical protein
MLGAAKEQTVKRTHSQNQARFNHGSPECYHHNPWGELMTRIAAVLLFPFVLTAPVLAADERALASGAAGQCDTLAAAAPEILARRGCCSWHGGVCGCSGARVKCCNGGLSPSCTCKDATPQPGLVAEDAQTGDALVAMHPTAGVDVMVGGR